MTSDNASLFASLDAVSARIVDSDGQIPDKYLTPWRGEKGSALCVVAPTTIDEVRSIIALAKEHHFRIVPQGANTGLVGGTVPNDQETVIVTLERLRSRCEFNETEQVVTVDAGFHLSEVNDYLATFGVCVPINVSSDPMVGAMTATNIAGSRVVKYGDMRHLCAGIEVVLADENESVYSTLGRPRKDNSSLNFTQLFVGSFGACGIITTVGLHVVPIVRQTQTTWISLTNNADISELITRIERGSKDTLLACELISREALNALKSSDAQQSSTDVVPFANVNEDVVFIEWGSNNEEIDIDQIAEKIIVEVIENSLATDAQVVPSATSWQLRHRVSEAVQESGKLIGCDISVTRDNFSELRSQCRAKVASLNPQLLVCDFGHVGDGGVHMNVVIPSSITLSPEEIEGIRFALSEIAVSLGGSFSAEHGLGSFNTALYNAFTDPTTKSLAHNFAIQCDPHNVLGHSGIHL